MFNEIDGQGIEIEDWPEEVRRSREFNINLRYCLVIVLLFYWINFGGTPTHLRR